MNPVAYIEHHKGGDNLTWDRIDHPYAKATPLYPSPSGRVLFDTDSYCPSCGHNRDTSSVSSIDHEDGTHSCQHCGTRWLERHYAAPSASSPTKEQP